MPYFLDSLCILRIKWSLTLKFAERLLSSKEHLGVHWQKYWAWTGAIRGTCWSFMGPLGPCVVHRSPQILLSLSVAFPDSWLLIGQLHPMPLGLLGRGPILATPIVWSFLHSLGFIFKAPHNCLSRPTCKDSDSGVYFLVLPALHNSFDCASFSL